MLGNTFFSQARKPLKPSNRAQIYIYIFYSDQFLAEKACRHTSSIIFSAFEAKLRLQIGL